MTKDVEQQKYSVASINPLAWLSGEGANGRIGPGIGAGERMSERANALFFGYSRVSTEEQAESRNGLHAQVATIDAEAERRGWVIRVFERFASVYGRPPTSTGVSRCVSQRLAAGVAPG
jgi:hypothetical protein